MNPVHWMARRSGRPVIVLFVPQPRHHLILPTQVGATKCPFCEKPYNAKICTNTKCWVDANPKVSP